MTTKKNLTVLANLKKERVQLPVKQRREIFEDIIRKEKEEKLKYEPRRKKHEVTEHNNLKETDLVKNKTIERKYVDFENVGESCENLKLQELPIAVVSQKSQPLAATTPQCQKMGGGRGHFRLSNTAKKKKNVNFKNISQIENFFKNEGHTVAKLVLTCDVLANPEQTLQGSPEDRLPPSPSRQAAQLTTHQTRRSVCTTVDPPTNHHSAACLEGKKTTNQKKGPGHVTAGGIKR